MPIPPEKTYKMAILRHLVNRYEGELRDEKEGVTRRLWADLGNKIGESTSSVSATLGRLEEDGALVLERRRQPHWSGPSKLITAALVVEPDSVVPGNSENHYVPHPNYSRSAAVDHAHNLTDEQLAVLAQYLLREAVDAINAQSEASVAGTLLTAVENERAELQKHVEKLADTLRGSREEVESLRATLQETAKRSQEAQESAATAAAQVREAQADTKRQKAALASLQTEYEKLNKRMGDRNKVMVDLQREKLELEVEVERLRKAAAAMEAHAELTRLRVPLSPQVRQRVVDLAEEAGIQL